MSEFVASEEQSQKANYAAIHARLMGREKPPKPRLSARQKMDAVIVKAEADLAKTYTPRIRFSPIQLIAMPTWRRIMCEVCEKHQVKVNEVLSHRRDRNIVAARHEISYRYKTETSMSYPEMGRRLNRDHSSILSGVRKHLKRIQEGTAK